MLNNIYPPIMDTLMPSFVKTSGCKVYFSLSNFNNKNELDDYIQVSVKFQTNNQSALISTYNTGIMYKKIMQEDEDIYYITIDNNDIMNGFQKNNYYKVQLRFGKKGVFSNEGILKDNLQSSTFIYNNISEFSEWSKVCLIKGISKPKFDFKPFVFDNFTEVGFKNASYNRVVGVMSMEEGEKEYLKSYRIKAIELKTEQVVFDSKDIYTDLNSPNSIDYKILYRFSENKHYALLFSYVTSGDYTEELRAKFYITNTYEDIIDKNAFECELDRQDARMKVSLNLGDIMTMADIILESPEGAIVFRRASNETDFTYWEDVKIFKTNELKNILNSKSQMCVWYDYTIESGVIYQYGVQKMKGDGSRAPLTICEDKADNVEGYWMCDMDNIFLTTREKQLKITFNPNVNSFNKVIMEGKNETLGSKYPYLYRSGNVNYKSFPISGTISHLMDDNYIFLNKEVFNIDDIDEYEVDKDGNPITDSVQHKIVKQKDLNRKVVYDKWYDKYNTYNKNMKISDLNDYIFEKKFRDIVIDFLTDGEPKLYRSATEGNVIIVLSGVSFTPNTQLGNYIYDFSATAYEVDECNFENYVEYNLHKRESENIIYQGENVIDPDLVKIGQIQISPSNNSINLLDLLKDKYGSIDNKKKKVVYIDDKPISYLYWIEDNSIENIKINFEDTESKKYTFKVDGKDIYVRGLTSNYEIDNPQSIIFEKNTQANLIYKVVLKREFLKNIEDEISYTYITTSVGQIGKMFENEEDVIELIKEKYNITTSTAMQKVLKIKNIIIETLPGVSMLINDKTVIMNNSGILELNDVELNSIKFNGYLLKEDASENTYRVREDEYSIYSPTWPYQENFIYDEKICYDENFYKTEWSNGLLKIPVSALITYIFELEQGVK